MRNLPRLFWRLLLILQKQEYSDIRRVINREEPVSGAKLFFDELKADSTKTSSFRPPPPGMNGRRIGAGNDDSSEDEGEIIEDT